MAATTAVVAAVAIAAAGTAYSIQKQEEMSEKADKESKKQERYQRAAMVEAQAKEEADEQKGIALKSRDETRRRQRALSNQAGGRQGTILTSPLGAVGDAGASGAQTGAAATGGGQKTLLGV